MKISENKKSNRYAALATYLFAVVCLIAGLFLPLFNGKEILALQLPKAINFVAGQDIVTFGKDFSLGGIFVLTFGAEGVAVDVLALVLLLYFLVTVLSLLALIPIIISVVKDTKCAVVFEYIIETATVLVLSLYFILALSSMGTVPDETNPLNCYNMVIALGGPLLMLIVLSFMNKRVNALAKLVLFVLGAVGVLSLFSLTAIITALPNIADTLKLAPHFFGSYNGAAFTNTVFFGGFSELMALAEDAKTKALIILSIITSLAVILNYMLDVISLSTNGKRTGLIFNIARYSLTIASVICLLITLAVSKVMIGLLLILVTVVAVLQLLISVLRYLIYRKKVKKSEEDAYEEEQRVRFEMPAKKLRKKPEDIEVVVTSEVTKPVVGDGEARQMTIIDGMAQPVQNEQSEQPEVLRDDGSVQMDISDIRIEEPQEIRAAAESVYTVEQPEIAPAPEVVSTPAPAPVAPAPEVVSTPAPAPVAPAPEVVSTPAPAPVAPASEVVSTHAPAPVAPAPEVVNTPAPAPKVVNTPAPAPAPAHVTPAPAPVAAQPNVEVYTINKVYGGPVDDFIRKLSNNEQIEFAMTFIERNKGDLSNLPEYVIGGDNKKFFNSVFIYLGRLRGMISDGLLNKMFKELNML